jgi:uncharacterized protein YndB with AHSA1/START domain
VSAGPVRKAVTVPLPPAAAFRLFTEGIDGWWPRRGPTRPRGRLRLTPGRGGAVGEERPSGASPRWATITVWEPGRRLVMTWHHGHPENEEPSEVAVTFTPVEAGTRVEVSHAALSLSGHGRTAGRRRRPVPA